MYIHPSKFQEIISQFKNCNAIQQARLNSEYGLDEAAGYSQHLEVPEPIIRGIPTLEKGTYVKASEMLECRFRFASGWKDAVLGIRLLSISEMEDVWADERTLEQIAIRREHWEDSPPAKLPLGKISLFGVNPNEGEEVYLVWSGSAEPSVVEYIGGDEQKFDSIADFFLFHSQDIS
jgi:hypothetical protein